MNLRLTLMILHLFPLAARAQPAVHSFRNIAINDGLSQNSVVSITMDKKGFVWFATQDGLNRYDGKDFEIIPRNFDDITTPTYSRLGEIHCTDSNTLWLLTSRGRLEKMDLRTGIISPFTIDAPAPVTRPITASSPSIQNLPPITTFYQDHEHNLWLGTTGNGVYHYQPATGKLTHYPDSIFHPNSHPSQTGCTAPATAINHTFPATNHTFPSTATNHSFPVPPTTNASIQSFFQDQQGNHWVLSTTGLTRLNRIKDTHSVQSPPEHTQLLLSSIPCSRMDQDREGTYWLGTYGKGLYRKRPADSSFTPFGGFGNKPALPAHLVIEAVLADRDGNIWIGSYGSGLYVITPSGKRIRHYSANARNPFAIAYNDVLCIKEDAGGGIWIGTDGGGVSHYDKRLNNFTLLSAGNLPDNISIAQVRAITSAHDGSLWIGTSNNGLTWSDPGRTNFRTTHLPPYKPGITNYDRIVALTTDPSGEIWAGTQGNGLLLLDHRTAAILGRFYPGAPAPYSLPDHTVWCMLPDTGNLLWIGTRNAGLCLLDRRRGILKRMAAGAPGKSCLPEDNVRSLLRIDDSTICIGFENRGIRLLNTRTFECTATPLSLERPEGGEIQLKCQYYRYPCLWVGTLSNGLKVWHIPSGTVYSITERQGLPNNTIYSILPDTSGSLWMSSNKGIFRLCPPEDLHKVDRTHYSLFTAEDGLQSNEFNTGAGYRAPDGNLYFGGINGISGLSADGFITPAQPVPVAITRVTTVHKPLQTDTAIPYLHNITLPFKNNSFSCNFAALEFSAPGRFNYYYQLAGYDDTWIDAGVRNYAAYTNLRPGSYQFRVKASRYPSGKEASITTMTITVLPPFWRTGWFILLSSLLITGLLYAGYRYRIGQILREQHIRHRIASDLHDDIGSTLTNISMLSELSRKNLLKQQEATLFLGRIGEEVLHSTQALDDIVWSIKASNDTIEQTIARMRRYVAEIFEAACINYTLSVDESFGRRKLNMEQRRDFFLIFKEIINNIHKHAHARNVYIRVWLEKNLLCMEVGDDGIGFNPMSTTHRSGIKNMHYRAGKWKGSVDILSAPISPAPSSSFSKSADNPNRQHPPEAACNNATPFQKGAPTSGNGSLIRVCIPLA